MGSWGRVGQLSHQPRGRVVGHTPDSVCVCVCMYVPLCCKFVHVCCAGRLCTRVLSSLGVVSVTGVVWGLLTPAGVTLAAAGGPVCQGLPQGLRQGHFMSCAVLRCGGAVLGSHNRACTALHMTEAQCCSLD